MNIYDISQKAGVSIATVSRVINNNPNVSSTTRNRILKIMVETGYTPNAFARGLGLNTMHTIGILCADSSDAYLATCVYHLEQYLRKHSYDSLLCCTGYDHRTRIKYMNLLLSKRVDAIILVGSNFVESTNSKNDYILKASETVPIIIIGGLLEAPNIYCTSCDDENASYQGTRFLTQQGKHRLLHLCRRLSYGGLNKINGFQRAVKESDIAPTESRVLQITSSIPEAAKTIANLYEDYPFNGVLAADDELAVSVIKFAGQMHLSIPDEISVIGYNNSVMGLCCTPELTSIDNHIDKLAINAAKTLLKVLNRKKAIHISVFPGTLIVRGSTFPVE